jgi:DNA modification methylase
MKSWRIINDDCLTAMAKLDDNSVDLVVTSPPYNNWRNRRVSANHAAYWKRTAIVYNSYHDQMSDADYAAWQIKVINECIRILKPSGTLCYNHKDRIFNFQATSPLTWILQSKAVFRQRITWDRCGMQARTVVRFYRNEEDIYILGKQASGYTWNKDACKYMSIWKIPPSRNLGLHPCSFPVELPSRCIKAFTHSGMLVLDPFCGSGTVGVACLELGRRFIGMDTDAGYCKLAAERLRAVSPPHVEL